MNEQIIAEEDVTQNILRESSISGQSELPEIANENSPLLGTTNGDGAIPTGKILNEWEGVSWWRRPSVYLLLPPFILFTIGFGSIAVPKLNIIMELICREYYADRNLLDGDTLNRELFSDDKQCKIPEIQALVSRFALYLQLIAGVLGAITSPILGAYSDRHGRRIVMAISSFGLLASEIVSILAVKYPHVFSVNFLLVGAFVDGLTGSFMVGMAIAHSYVADCTSMEKRAVHFGYIVGGLYLGIAVGPALGGLLIKATGNPLHVFYAALVAHGLFIVYIAAVLPESLTPSRMRLAQEKYDHQQSLRDNEGPRGYFQQLKSWNPLQPLAILFPTGPGSSPRLRTNLVVLAAVDTLFVGVGMGAMTVTIIYAEMAFNWGNYESSIYVSFVNSARVIVLFAIMPLLVKAINAISRRRQTVDTSPHEHESDSQDLKHSGASTLDIVSIRLAIFIELVGYLCYAAAMNGAEFTLAGIITALGGVGSPTVQSALTKHVPQDKTGQLLGASALLRSLARVFFPTLFNLVYAGTVGTFPQTVFVCLASVFLLSAVCSMFITPHVKLHEDKHGNVVDGEHVSSTSTPTSPTTSSSVTGSATV